MTGSDGRFRAGWLLLIGGAALAIGGAVLRRSGVVRPSDVEARAQEVQQRAVSTLAASGRTLEAEAVAAARVPELLSGLDIEADAHTFQDLFESEDWWGGYRTRFPLSSLVTEKGTLALLGPGTKDLAADTLVRRAREVGSASGVALGQGRAFLAAAAKITRNKHPELGAVVILGVPFEDRTLVAAADAVPYPAALALSDGTAVLAFADKGQGRAAVTSLVGQEAAGAHLLDDQHAAHAFSLGPGLWVLAVFPAPAEVSSSAAWPLVMGGLSLAILGLVLLLSTPRAASQTALASHRAGGPGPLGAPAPVAPPVPAAPSFPASFSPSAPAPLPVTSADSLGASSAAAAFAATPPERLKKSPGLERLRNPRDPAPWEDPATLANTPGRHTLALHPSGALPALAMTPSSTFQMGRYMLIERIGEGGMAEIFFARSHGAEGFVRDLVVKRMHPHLARNRLAVSQFIDEARVQSELVHPNIVPVLDFGKAGDEYFLALDFVHGRDLGRVIARHVENTGESLPLRIAFYVMHEVLEALEFAHNKIGKDGTPLEVVHRDVAPGNVLVSFLGEVKLSDFGIAKSEHRVSHTEVGMVKGNASFMSPEQARGEVVDRRSDLFSAGVVLFYMLTAKLLYRGETTLNQLLRAAVGPSTSQFAAVDNFSGPAQAILQKALASQAANRFQSARDFSSSLAPFMATRKEMLQLMTALFPPHERG